jgi:HlyD family secretion protein
VFKRKQDIYRSKALDRLSSPESLDQLMFVVTARDWIPLVAIGALIALIVAWSLGGSIPTAVTGRTVLVYPSRLVEIQTATAGRLDNLMIAVGDVVKEGAILGTIDQSEIVRQLQQDRGTLADLQSQDKLKTTLQEHRAAIEQQEIEAARRFIQLQDPTLRKSLLDAQTMDPALKRRLDGYRNLKDQGLLPELSNDLLQAQQAVLDNAAKIADLNTRITQLDSQLKQLDTREATITRDSVDTSTSRTNAMRELASRISINDLQLGRDSEIRSQKSGRIVELAATRGQVVTLGARIATLEVDAPGSTLMSVSFFPVGDGKQIQPGMLIQVTPDSVERQRYGGIVGKVVSVSILPVTKASAELLVGNAEIVQSLMPGGPYIQVMSSLNTDSATFSGYKWSSSAGPKLQVTPGMTGSNRVTIEGRAPITYIFPFLKSSSGLQ